MNIKQAHVLNGGSIYDCFIYDDTKVNSNVPLNRFDQENTKCEIEV